MDTLRATANALAYMLRARAWTLRKRGPAWREITDAWQQRAEEATAQAAPLDGADRFRVLTRGEEGFAARAALYASARATVDLATYYIQADETGRATVQALSDCVARGVRVRLLVDRGLTVHKEQEVAGTIALLARARDAGIAVQQWRDPRRRYDAQHRKILLIDDRAAIVGGRNIADHYSGDDWRDADLLIEGPSAGALAPLFEAVWVGAPPPREVGPWVDYVPERVTDDGIAIATIAAIDGATRSVDLELAYFAVPDALRGALTRAARRGVRVRLLTNSAASNDLWFTVWASHAGMRRLIGAGCQVHARQGRGRTLHSKLAIVDEAWVTVGSHNLDYYSSRYCCETNLVVRDARLATALGAFFDAGLADARVVSDEVAREVCRRSRVSRLFDRVFRDFQ